MQPVRAEMNVGDLGSIPSPDLIVMTPLLSGSGKFGTPCLRMHSENFSPEAEVPTAMPISKCAVGPEGTGPLTGGPELPCVVVVVVPAGGDEARFATPGEFPPPPQPAASSETAAANGAMMSERRMDMPEG